MVLSMDRWKGKVAIVTGASSGIGAAICEQLVDAGMKVVGLGRRKELIEELSRKLQNKPGKLYAVKCDMTSESDILKAFKWTISQVGPVAILVNNAGIFKGIDLTSPSIEDMRKTIDTNVIGLTIASGEALKNMMENKVDGHIIHISSVAGHGVPYPQMGTYCASKHAVKALTEGLRMDLNTHKSKIKITSISPGAVDTEILSALPKEIKDITPMLKAEHIADAVTYVLSTPLGVQVHELIIKPTGENV